MKNIYTLLINAIIISLSVLYSTNLHAQATRTWVSGVGDDVNPCSRTAPCKTFAGAISKTAAGGEISVLDPAGFGGVTITKSMTISGDGSLGSVLVSGTNGIIINAAATDVVTIRSISIIGVGPSGGVNGINYIAGGQVHIENCTISGFATTGILVNLTASGILTAKNTSIKLNTTGGSFASAAGISVKTTTGTAVATVDNVHVQGLPIGIRGQDNSTINVENSVISNNATGVLADHNTSIIRLSNAGIFNNTTAGVSITPATTGKIYSFGNNKLAGNGANSPMSVISTQ